MKILGMGMPELLIILGVILLIFGPKNLPKLGAALGSTVKNLREGLGGDKKVESVDDDAEIVESEDETPPRATSPRPRRRCAPARPPRHAIPRAARKRMRCSFP